MTNFDGYFITNNLESDRLRCTLYLYYTVALILCQVPFLFLLYFIEIVFLLCFQNLLRLWFGFVWICLALFALFGFVWLCLLCLALFALFSKFAPLRSQILKRGSFDLFVRISEMQINGSFQIVTSLHLSYQHFLAALRFCFFTFAVLLFVLLYLLDCALGCFAPAGATTGFALWIPTSL